MEPGGCKQFLGRADRKDNFQLLATLFSLTLVDAVTASNSLENAGLIEALKARGGWKQRQTNLAAENRTLKVQRERNGFQGKKSYNIL